MPVYLPKDVELPPVQEINASLLITKYTHVKTRVEKDDSAKIARRSCKGKSEPKHLFRYSQMKGAKSLFMRLEDRLIVDQSGGVQENAHLCLHPHFGVPMIPGSAVKGVARHYLWELWNDAEGAEKDVLESELYEIFGDAEQSGKISFLSARPVGGASLEVDVLTCHHMDYYSPQNGKDKATDDESPNPQFFPVVKKGATFEFVVYPTARGTAQMAERALSLLKDALELNGIGAKTAAGYGWFSEDEKEAENQRTEREARESKATEEVRRSNLSPVDLAKEDLLKTADFGTAVNDILQSGSPAQKRALVQLYNADKSSDWKELKKRAKKKPKAKSKVDSILQLAQELREELS